MKILTIAGDRVAGPNGAAFQERVAGVPNLKIGATITLVRPASSNERYGKITIVAALPSEITAAKIVWSGVNGTGQRASNSWPFPSETLSAMKAAAGTYDLAPESEMLGVLLNGAVRRCRLVLRNSTGWGTVRDLSGFVDQDDPTVPFVWNANPVLTGSPTEGADVVFTPLDWSGGPGVEITYQYQMTEDTSSTSPGTAYAATGKVPFINGAKDCFRIRAYAYDPATSTTYGPYDTASVAITPASVVTVVSKATDAVFATRKISVKSMLGTAPVPGPSSSVTSGSASATIIAWVPNPADAAKGDIFTGEIANGPIAANAALTWTGGSGAADGASAAYPLTAGMPFYILPFAYNGTPTDRKIVFELANDSAETGKKAVDLAGTIPPYFGLKYLRYSEDVLGYGLTTALRSSLAWMVIGVPTLAKIADSEWRAIEATPVTGGDRIDYVYTLASLFISKLWWTRSSDERLAGVQFPTDYEPFTWVSQVTIAGVLYDKWAANDAIYGGVNYRVVATDATTRTLGIVGEIGGARTPLSNRKAVPSGTPAAARAFVRQTARSEGQERQGEMGGCGMQFPRAHDVDGDYVHMGYDITWGSESSDFGDTWTSDECDGLYINLTYEGVCVDGKYVHVLVGPAFMEPLGNHDSKGGLYRKDRTTKKWTSTKAYAKILGSNDNGSPAVRRQMRRICKVAGSGSGPDTRTLYAAIAPGSTISAVTSIQIIKSTSGGSAGSWADDGDALAVSTYGMPYGVFADTTALYMWTSNGVYRRPIGSDTWTKATLASGSVLHFEKRGSTLYVLVASKGVYKASDGTTPNFSTQIWSNAKASWFSVCPSNTQKIIAIGEHPQKYTTNGGTDWTNGVSLEYPGQPGDWHHKMAGDMCWVRWHDTDPNMLIAMRNQHMGKSTDGGRTFFWSSRNNDYSEIRSFAFHRTDYRRMFMTMTDRLLLASDHGGEFVMDDDVGSTLKDTIKDATPYKVNGVDTRPSALTARGAVLLDRGTRTGYVAQCGYHTGPKIPLMSSRGVTTTRTDTTDTGNGSISVTASPNLPCGTYTLTCTTAAANGGTFTGVGPLGVSLGTWTVGTARTYTHPRGGTLAVTIADGSVDFKAGNTPCVFTIEVNPIKTQTANTSVTVKHTSWYGAVNPAVGYRGISGRCVFEMATDGSIALTRYIDYPIIGYMGTSGNVILAHSSDTTLMRHANEGDTGVSAWTTFASGLDNISGRGTPVAFASAHDSQRAYVGCSNGKVYRIQAGTKTLIFDFDAWCDANSITAAFPGNSVIGGRYVPACSGVVESFYNPNLVYASFFTIGAPLQLFRTEKALSATSTDWENISVGGLTGPIQGLTIHPLTDEPIIVSAHGTVWYKPKAAHLAAYSITDSVVDDLLAGPGGSDYATIPV